MSQELREGLHLTSNSGLLCVFSRVQIPLYTHKPSFLVGAYRILDPLTGPVTQRLAARGVVDSLCEVVAGELGGFVSSDSITPASLEQFSPVYLPLFTGLSRYDELSAVRKHMHAAGLSSYFVDELLEPRDVVVDAVEEYVDSLSLYGRSIDFSLQQKELVRSPWLRQE